MQFSGFLEVEKNSPLAVTQFSEDNVKKRSSFSIRITYQCLFISLKGGNRERKDWVDSSGNCCKRRQFSGLF